jgi:hypothetical protein
MSHSELPHEVTAALEKGDKIEAIKLLRKATGLGLKESKEAIEAHLESNAALHSMVEARGGKGSGCDSAALAFLALAGVLASQTWL